MSSWENCSRNDMLRLKKTLYYRKLLQQAASLAVLAVRLVPCQHPLQVEPGEAHGVCLLQLPEAIQQLSAVGAVVKVIRMLQPIAPASAALSRRRPETPPVGRLTMPAPGALTVHGRWRACAGPESWDAGGRKSRAGLFPAGRAAAAWQRYCSGGMPGCPCRQEPLPDAPLQKNGSSFPPCGPDLSSSFL